MCLIQKYVIIEMMETLDSEMYHAGKQGIKITIICPYVINIELTKLNPVSKT